MLEVWVRGLDARVGGVRHFPQVDVLHLLTPKGLQRYRFEKTKNKNAVLCVLARKLRTLWCGRELVRVCAHASTLEPQLRDYEQVHKRAFAYFLLGGNGFCN